MGPGNGPAAVTCSAVLAATDPNWLLSTTAQSAAALVAIIGGLLASQVLAEQANRQRLDAEIADQAHRLNAIAEEAAEASDSAKYWQDAIDEEAHIVPTVWTERRNTAEDRATELGFAFREANTRLELLRARRITGPPPGLRRALAVLFAFGVGGVAFPVVAMACGVQGEVWVRSMTVALFAVGLALVAWHLWSAVTELDRASSANGVQTNADEPARTGPDDGPS